MWGKGNTQERLPFKCVIIVKNEVVQLWEVKGNIGNDHLIVFCGL